MKLISAIFLIIITLNVTGQNREHAFEVNDKLGRGINYGNMFEAPSEAAWGNPWKPAYARMIANLGFNHIRIPVRWEPDSRSSATPPYTIKPIFLNRIKQVVDSALNNNLYAIINMHHHNDLFADPMGQKERFLAQWKQISAFFKDYPDSLLFEILNEPNGNVTASIWNDFAAEALDTIRVENPERIVLITTSNWGGLGGLPYLQLPDDENIILTIHYYNPFHFTHQGAGWVAGSDAWLGTTWEDSKTERQVVKSDFAPLIAFSNQHNIPVHVGEFGSYSTADERSRSKWSTFIPRYIESLGFSWAYWEWSAGFGVYKPNTGQYVDYLKDALLHNPLPDPATYVGTTVYHSDFRNTKDGWVLYKQSTASATLTTSDNNLVSTISNGGTQEWHVQLVKNNISLKAGKKYRFSFKAKADTARIASTYLGMSVSPWSSYSGYNSISVTDTFSHYTFMFDMTQNDNNARIVFDLGTSDVDFTMTDFLLEEVVLVPPAEATIAPDFKTTVFPNPVGEQLFVNNLDNFSQATVLNINGKVISKRVLSPYLNSLSTNDMPPGIYLVRLSGDKGSISLKIIKK